MALKTDARIRWACYLNTHDRPDLRRAAETEIVVHNPDEAIKMATLRWIMLFFAISAISVTTTGGLTQSPASYVPPNGFVPDPATAARIAEAVWIPIYGAERIAKEKPFKVTLKADVWTVTGRDLPAGTAGGGAEAEISERDGRILRVIHGQ